MSNRKRARRPGAGLERGPGGVVDQDERTAAELTFTMTPALFPLELLLYQNGAVVATKEWIEVMK